MTDKELFEYLSSIADSVQFDNEEDGWLIGKVYVDMNGSFSRLCWLPVFSRGHGDFTEFELHVYGYNQAIVWAGSYRTNNKYKSKIIERKLFNEFKMKNDLMVLN